MPFGGESNEHIFKKKYVSAFCLLFSKFFFSLQDCGAETNIWKCLKRIVELKQDHLTARKEAEKKVLRTAIHFLTDIIAELETFVDRYVYISLKDNVPINYALSKRDNTIFKIFVGHTDS